jgi:hypothetical protein
MKKLLLTLLGIVFIFCAMSQNNSKSVNYVLQKTVKMYKIDGKVIKLLKNDTIKILSSNVDFYDVEYKKTFGSISRFYFNANEEKQIKLLLNNTSNIVLIGNSSYYLKKASNNLVTGLYLGIGGGIVVSTATFVFPIKDGYWGWDKNKTAREIATYTGIAMGIVGIVETVIGATQIGKAGIALDNERKIFMSPSKSGVGIEIKF